MLSFKILQSIILTGRGDEEKSVLIGTDGRAAPASTAEEEDSASFFSSDGRACCWLAPLASALIGSSDDEQESSESDAIVNLNSSDLKHRDGESAARCVMDLADPYQTRGKEPLATVADERIAIPREPAEEENDAAMEEGINSSTVLVGAREQQQQLKEKISRLEMGALSDRRRREVDGALEEEMEGMAVATTLEISGAREERHKSGEKEEGCGNAESRNKSLELKIQRGEGAHSRPRESSSVDQLEQKKEAAARGGNQESAIEQVERLKSQLAREQNDEHEKETRALQAQLHHSTSSKRGANKTINPASVMAGRDILNRNKEARSSGQQVFSSSACQRRSQQRCKRNNDSGRLDRRHHSLNNFTRGDDEAPIGWRSVGRRSLDDMLSCREHHVSDEDGGNFSFFALPAAESRNWQPQYVDVQEHNKDHIMYGSGQGNADSDYAVEHNGRDGSSIHKEGPSLFQPRMHHQMRQGPVVGGGTRRWEGRNRQTEYRGNNEAACFESRRRSCTDFASMLVNGSFACQWSNAARCNSLHDIIGQKGASSCREDDYGPCRRPNRPKNFGCFPSSPSSSSSSQPWG